MRHSMGHWQLPPQVLRGRASTRAYSRRAVTGGITMWRTGPTLPASLSPPGLLAEAGLLWRRVSTLARGGAFLARGALLFTQGHTSRWCAAQQYRAKRQPEQRWSEAEATKEWWHRLSALAPSNTWAATVPPAR